MTLFEKLCAIYQTLTIDDFSPSTGTIVLQDDGDGAYIRAWHHPTLEQPTEEILASIAD